MLPYLLIYGLAILAAIAVLGFVFGCSGGTAPSGAHSSPKHNPERVTAEQRLFDQIHSASFQIGIAIGDLADALEAAGHALFER